MSLSRIVAAVAALFAATAGLAAGDIDRGAQLFSACTACHSLIPGEHRTGPSLADVYGRRAGTVEGFHRYSEALRKADAVWDDQTLDAWLRDPAAFVPGNAMVFRGLADAGERSDLIAFMQAVSKGQVVAPEDRSLPDLKQVDAEHRVAAIGHCGDTYHVTLGDGETLAFWEFNLRFKTDSSRQGPRQHEPVMVPAGMGGDRAQVVFAAPAEISAFIRSECK